MDPPNTPAGEDRREAERLAVENRHLKRIIQTLGKITALPALGDKTGNIFNELLSVALELLGGDGGSLMLRQGDSDYLTIVAAEGISEDIARNTSVKIGEGIAGRVAQLRKPSLLTGESLDARAYSLGNPDKIKDAISVPVIWKDTLLGVFNLNNKKSGDFSRSDLETLLIFANQGAAIIHEYQSRRTVDQSYLNMVTTLAEAVDLRDPYTFGHSKAVRDYSLGISGQLELDAAQSGRIEIAALLHDIGKLSIADSVLQQESALTDEEYALIKTHPKMGARILEPVEYFADIVPGILHHHERYDGSGYPNGLRGDAIPLEARILAIGDAFDAMSSKRSYRQLLTTDQILSELRKGRGGQFDPHILDAFLEAFEIDRRLYRAGESRLGEDIHHEFNYYTLAVRDRPAEVELTSAMMSKLVAAFLARVDSYGGPRVKDRVIKKLNSFSIEHRLDFMITDDRPGIDKLLPITLVELSKRFQAFLDQMLIVTSATLGSRVTEQILSETSSGFDGAAEKLFNHAIDAGRYSRKAA